MSDEYDRILSGDENIVYIFDKNFHPMDYIKQSREGLSQVHIMNKWLVSPLTFSNWKLKHRELREAILIGKAAFQVYWIDYLKDNLRYSAKEVFNQRGWEKIMSYGNMNNEERVLPIEKLQKLKTLKKKNKYVLELLSDQLVTLSEAHQLQDLISKQYNVDEHQELIEKLNEIEQEMNKR